MIRIDKDSVLLDTDVANDLANLLAEDETAEIQMSVDSEWTLIIDVINCADEISRMTVEDGLWESRFNA